MQEIREVAVRHISAKEIGEVVARGQPVIFFSGRPRLARVYGLPVDQFGAQIEVVYHEIGALRTGRLGLSESYLMAIITQQVDDKWRPFGYGILNIDDQDVFYIVPANAYWHRAVEGE